VCESSKIDAPESVEKNDNNIYTASLAFSSVPLCPVKNHEVRPVVVSRGGNIGSRRGVGNMRAPRVNDMITSNAGRHAMYRRREEKNVRVGVVKVAPERIESFAESSREIRRAEQQRDEKVEEKGWDERDSRQAGCLLARARDTG